MKRIFFLLGSAQALCCVFMLFAGNLRQNIVLCEIIFFAALRPVSKFANACSVSRKNGTPCRAAQNRKGYGLFLQQNYYLICIIFFAVLLPRHPLVQSLRRCLMISTAMSGKGKWWPPASTRLPQRLLIRLLRTLRDQAIYPNIARSTLTAIYPPLSQFIFALSAWLCPGVQGMKLMFVFFDVLTIGILLLTLRALSIPLTRIAIYAMNPLVIMEFAGNGHSDSAGIFFLLCALYLFLKKRTYSPVVCLALSVLNKFLPLFLLPFMLGRKKAAAILLFVAASALFYVPFLSAGTKLFQSLGIYIEHWFFNASLYDLFYWVFNDKIAAQRLSAILFLLIMTGMFVLVHPQKLR